MHNLLAYASPSLIAASALFAVWNSVWPYIVMLIGFSIIVFVHELGHFAVAKWAGVRVERFAIGFGRELFGFTRGETRYSFNILPLGGYVKMLGQEDFDDKENELMFNDDPRSFVNKPVGHRMAIVSAGVVMNILFACLLFMAVFMYGKEVIGTKIAYVLPDSPAERSGLRPGDVIRKINDDKILEFNEVMMAIVLAPPHEPIKFEVERNGEQVTIDVQPEYIVPESSRDGRRQKIGIAPGVTRVILGTGPELDPNNPDHPRSGDTLVEINGIEVTDDNINELVNLLAYVEGDVYVKRTDPTDPAAAPQRVKVSIPPILSVYPTKTNGDPAINVLGLTPLARFDTVSPNGRAYLAGIEAGDTVLSWDDVPNASLGTIAHAIRDNSERDIHFKVQKFDGRILEGFVRPQSNARGPATIHATCQSAGDEIPAGEPKSVFTRVRPQGIAATAGIEVGDAIVSCMGIKNPTMSDVNRAIRAGTDRALSVKVRKADGKVAWLEVVPEAPGSIDARYNLLADDLLRVGSVVDTINGMPSPAKVAGITAGVLITSVNGEKITRWRELIAAFRKFAGTSVDLGYVDASGQAQATKFPVPHSLRTMLGVGPEARIVSVDGRRTVMVDSIRGAEDVAVGYREGTKKILQELVGRTQVPVEFRRNLLAEIETGYIDVTEGMIDPWLGRISFTANLQVAGETVMLRGENAWDAVWIGIHKTYYFMIQVYKTMERMIFTRSVGVENISGPLGIIDMGGKVARAGIIDFIFFMAIISANLAVINFLPLPIVDGGLMIFLIIEKIKGSPVSLRVQVATQMIGLFLIIGIFLFVTFNDAMRLWG
jgi:membrane-associated protease RseP (regulator of RpoE activity)